MAERENVRYFSSWAPQSSYTGVGKCNFNYCRNQPWTNADINGVDIDGHYIEWFWFMWHHSISFL